MNVNRITDCLNSLVALDREAAEALVEARVPYKGDMAATAPFVVWQAKDGAQPMIGLLGILQGVVASVGCKIFAYYDEAGRLEGFVLKDNIEKAAPKPMAE